MSLYHPIAAAIDCHDCQRFDYDFKTGKRAAQVHEFHKIHREIQKTVPLQQCGDCPKKSPENAERLKLTDEHHEIINLFFECRTMNWQGVPQPVLNCWVLRRLFVQMEAIYSEVQKQREQAALIRTLASVMGGR